MSSRLKSYPSKALLLLSLWSVTVLLRLANGFVPPEGVWQGNGGPTPVINSVVVSDGQLLAGGYSGMYVSNDAGLSWRAIPLEPSGQSVTTIAAGPTGRFAAGPGMLWSEVNGQWVRLTPPTQGAIHDLLVSDDLLLAATEEGLMVRSLSAATEWRRLWPAPEAHGVAAYSVIQHGDRLMVGTDDGVFERAGSSSAWHSLGPSGRRVLGLSASNEYVYAALAQPGGGLARARLGSGGWEMGRVDSQAGATILVDPRKPELVYAGLSNLAEQQVVAGVVVSEDAGNSWSPLRTRLLNTQVGALALDPVRGVLYAATNGGGVFSYREPTLSGTLLGRVSAIVDFLDPLLLGMLALSLLLQRRRAGGGFQRRDHEGSTVGGGR